MGNLLLRAAVLAAAFVALVAFSVVLAKVTLTPSPASEDIVTSNLKPGRSLRQYAEDYTFLAACKQAGGNLLLGAPFGVLLPILVPRRLRMIRMTVLTVLVMAVVELVQGALVAGRAFDIDDVILNTAGALLGYALVGRRISHRYHALSDEPAAVDEAKPGPTRGRHGAGREEQGEAWCGVEEPEQDEVWCQGRARRRVEVRDRGEGRRQPRVRFRRTAERVRAGGSRTRSARQVAQPAGGPGRGSTRSPPARSLERRVGVLHQLLELGGEPLPGQRGVGQRAGHVVAVAALPR